MAQRGEGQGLQIAVISFAMLTIILAITTYVFYAQSQTAHKDLESKTKALNDKTTENGKLFYRVRAMQLVLGLKGTTKEDVEQAKGGAGGDDPEVKEILDNFATDSAVVGEQVAPEGPNSYRRINNVLLTALNNKNARASDAMVEARKANQDKEAAELAAKARADTAEASSKKAADDYGDESKKFAADRTQMQDEKDKLNTQIGSVAGKAKTDLQKVIEERDIFVKQNTQQKETIAALQKRLDELQKDRDNLFESPDGHIKKVDQRLRMVWIDAGRADGLLRQTTFSVYDHDENGVSNAKPKARIEVVSLDDHMAEARILEDTPANPIISGDLIHTPTWSPGQRVHFALAMRMDINKDGIDDYELVKNIIQMNGGVIDAELRPDGKRINNITVNTRYFVEGDRPDETTSKEVQNQYNAFESDRASFGVQKISVAKLLSFMGWKAEERTVELAGNRSGAFRKAANKTQPASGSAPADSAAPPNGSAAPPAPASDLFGAPAGAAPAAVPAVDPFAAPPAADPFAPK